MTSPLPDLSPTPERCVMSLSAQGQQPPELQQALEDYEAAPDKAEPDTRARICDANDCPLTLGELIDIQGGWMTESTTSADAERPKARLADLATRLPRGCLLSDVVEWQDLDL
jgi:hypothetical protein